MPNIINITDFMTPELDVYARMSEGELLNRHEPEKGIFIAESPKVIERALDFGCVPISILMEEKHIENQGKDIIMRCKDIPVYVAPFDVLTNLTGFKLTRGMLCAMRRPCMPALDTILSNAKRIAVILYRRAIRVSMGTVFQIPWTIIDEEMWKDNGVNILRSYGFKSVAMALRDDSVSIDDEKMLSEEKLAIVLGAEGDGLRDSTIVDCDYTVRIPMSHGVDSLNVAAASAVAFWELGKANI